MNKKKLLIISMPFKIGVGGFIRSYNVLPGLSKLLADRGYEIELYVPANAIRTVILNKLRMRTMNSEAGNNAKIIEMIIDAISEVRDETFRLMKSSGYNIFINDKVLELNIKYNLDVIRRELDHKSIFRFDKLVWRFRPTFIKYFEESFIGRIKGMICKPTYAYSMHETMESVTSVMSLSSKDTKTVVLMQLDFGRDPLEKVQNLRSLNRLSHKVKLVGLLSVSPAPLVESSEILRLCDRIEILSPGLAVDPIFLGGFSLSKIPNTVTYYGRISREKGIYDLLRAWRIVQSKTDAKLYVAGLFEEYNTVSEFTKVALKYQLKSISYIGYLDRARMPCLISRFHLLAYPSYRDSFSLTVLEALFMGLRVVAYDIPAIKYIYGKSSNVGFVPLGNHERLAIEILRNLDMKFTNDRHTMRILEKYSSWDNVIREEFTKLCRLLDNDYMSNKR